jgi:hypothetical protein
MPLSSLVSELEAVRGGLVLMDSIACHEEGSDVYEGIWNASPGDQ